jgi:hypothetical protein
MDTNATLTCDVDPQRGLGAARTTDLKSLLGWIVIIGLSIVNVFRASTQALIGDEALTYHWFLRGSWLDILFRYNANNHVLYSLLAKASISVFGVSELTVRIPALIAGVLYLIAAYSLSAFLFPRLLPFIFSLLLLTLNPLVLDFLSCARGYGLATAAFLWALYQCAIFMAGQRTSLIWAGIWCAISVCANFTLVTPVAALFAIVAIRMLWIRKSPRQFMAMLGTFTLICLCILWFPIHGAHRDQFYVGSETISESFRSLIDSYAPAAAFGSWQSVATGILLCSLALAAAKPRQFQILPIAVLGLSLAALCGAHAVFNVPLPVNRTGLYLIPLFSLSTVTVFENLPRRVIWNGGRAILAVLISVTLFSYVRSFRVDHYAVWWYDAETKHAIRDMKSLIERYRSPRPVSVAVTTWLYPSLEFYRILEPEWFTTRTIQHGCVPYDFYFDIPRAKAGGAGDGEVRQAGFGVKRFYLLHGADLPYLKDCGLAEVKRYPASSLVLATGPARDHSF